MNTTKINPGIRRDVNPIDAEEGELFVKLSDSTVYLVHNVEGRLRLVSLKTGSPWAVPAAGLYGTSGEKFERLRPGTEVVLTVQGG